MIVSKNELKILGVNLDCGITWELHLQKTISKVRSLIFWLRFVRRHLSLQDKVRIVQAQVISRLTFASPVWSHTISFRLCAKI